MNTRLDPKELAFIVAERAKDFINTQYQIGAVLADRHGIFAWGWCHRGDRPWLRSIHAERHCIERANPVRLSQAILYVAGQRRGTKRIILAKPCEQCQWFLSSKRTLDVVFSDPNAEGGWRSLYAA